MKKRFLVISIIILVGTLILSSCGQASQAPSPPLPPTTTQSMTQPAVTTHAGVTQPAPVVTVTRPPATTKPAATYPATSLPSYIIPQPTKPSSGTIGLSAGGSKDIANFRENIRNNYLPLPSDVTYEGLFFDYYFDTGVSEPSANLFSPSYSYAISQDPLSHQPEYYLSVGLNSGLKESDFTRKTLNLIIVLDNSGSMGEDFNQYYYDGYGNRKDAYEGEGIYRPKKMDSAKEAVLSILDQLEADDRFAIVLFNSTAFLLKPIGPVSSTNITQIKNKVLDVNAGGSTNLASGMDMAVEQFWNLHEVTDYQYENRIIILTDAQPNTGDISVSGITSRMQSTSNKRIYTTFIGIGVDFNSQLVEMITKTRGANYYSVHSPREFKSRLEDEFDFMVTPLVFNLRLTFESSGWRIEKVFGSPEASEATSELMKINTMFPAPKNESGEAKGGLVLLKLRRISLDSNEPIHLMAAYEDRNGEYFTNSVNISFESVSPDFFDNSGIRKGILLTRYAALLKNWLTDERQHLNYGRFWDPCIGEDTGILIPASTGLSQWERQSEPLRVSDSYRDIFRLFIRYFEQEMTWLRDNTLEQEWYILKLLSS